MALYNEMCRYKWPCVPRVVVPFIASRAAVNDDSRAAQHTRKWRLLIVLNIIASTSFATTSTSEVNTAAMINFAAFNPPLKARAQPKQCQTNQAEKYNYWNDLSEESADAYLEDLPLEVFSYISQYADRDSVLNLRLVSRTIRDKVTDKGFQRLFESLEVEASKWSLRSFVEVTQKGYLGSNVKHITIVGLVYDLSNLYYKASNRLYHAENADLFSPEAWLDMDAKVELSRHDYAAMRWAREKLQTLQQKGRDVDLLRKAFSNVAAASPLGLDSLTLDLGVYRDNVKNFARPSEAPETPREMMSDAAYHVFKLAMAALQSSSLKVKSLNVFTNSDSCSTSYGLSILDLSMIDCDVLARSQVLAALKRLSISICDDALQDTEKQVDCSEGCGIASILLACPNIEDLQVSNYGADASGWQIYPTAQQHLLWERQVSQLMYSGLSRLKTVRLEGFQVQTKDLARFIRNDSDALQSVTLERIIFQNRPFSVIAKILANELLSLTGVRVQDIAESYDDSLDQYVFKKRLCLHSLEDLQQYVEINGHQRWAGGYSTDSESE
jgi:hypothetical protein